MSELLNQAKTLAPEIVRWRRHIHENPEVSAVLPNTCAYGHRRAPQNGV